MIARRGKTVYFIGGGVALVILAAVLYRTLLYAPSVPHGYVALNTLPWGEVARIVTDTGQEVRLPGKTWTPCRLALPEGSYYIRVTNPMFAQPIVDTVTVRSNEVLRVTKTFAGFDEKQVLSKYQ